ncbi:enoyl-CoA hydratase-related protein [Xanthobacter sp. 126]|uniref:enoyl-CoA hydratase-related protein n=1 Tax=Xanthobacter sp. 126 TaxID=1131814 RepID=UPI00045E789B|nr:enoyl-CoA hydratase-related protein [Xanthobacter sp. 126]
MLRTEIDGDSIATLTLDQPGRPVNTLGWALVDALEAEVERLAGDAAVSGIIVTSGKSSFLAGADLSIMNGLAAPELALAETARRIGRMGALFRRLETCGKPVIAAAPGTALGAGLELMLASHYRLAADNPKGLFGLPEVTLGILPGAGGTQRVLRRLGIAAALPMLLEGRAMTAAEALEAGLIDALVPADGLIGAAKAALREGRVNPVAPWDAKGFRLPGLAPTSTAAGDLFALWNARVLARTRGEDPAPRAILSCLFEGARLPMDKALKVERDYCAGLIRSAQAQQKIAAFFARQAQKAGGAAATV